MSDFLVWQPQDISGGTVTFQPGQRYAVLASVDTGKYTTIPLIQDYVQKNGFTVTYICEIVAGSPNACNNRDEYSIDTWLQSITIAPRSGERWVYGEGNFVGSEPWTVDRTDSGLKAAFASYYIEDLFQAVEAPPSVVTPGGQVLPVQPVTPPSSSSSVGEYVFGGALAVVAGGALWWWLR